MSQTDPPTTPPPPNPTFVDIVSQTLNNTAEALIENVPEVRSIVYVIDWAVPLDSRIAPGVAYTRGPTGHSEEVRHPLPLFGLLQQHSRMGLILATRFQQLLLAADETASNLAKTINERQQYLDGLNAHIREAEARRDSGREPDELDKLIRPPGYDTVSRNLGAGSAAPPGGPADDVPGSGA